MNKILSAALLGLVCAGIAFGAEEQAAEAVAEAAAAVESVTVAEAAAPSTADAARYCFMSSTASGYSRRTTSAASISKTWLQACVISEAQSPVTTESAPGPSASISFRPTESFLKSALKRPSSSELDTGWRTPNAPFAVS